MLFNGTCLTSAKHWNPPIPCTSFQVNAPKQKDTDRAGNMPKNQGWEQMSCFISEGWPASLQLMSRGHTDIISAWRHGLWLHQTWKNKSANGDLSEKHPTSGCNWKWQTLYWIVTFFFFNTIAFWSKNKKPPRPVLPNKKMDVRTQRSCRFHWRSLRDVSLMLRWRMTFSALLLDSGDLFIKIPYSTADHLTSKKCYITLRCPWTR